MAHLIDLSNGRENIAYVGRKPWHGLGIELPPGQPLDTWRITAGLDFEYRLSPVRFLEGLTFPGRQVIYRSDTQMPIAVVSDQYHPVQPAEILEAFRDLTEAQGFEMEVAGALKDGALVWALAKTGDAFALGRDEVKQYFLLMTSCDKTLATRATLTSVRVVCWNTLTAALRQEAASLVTTSHAVRFDADVVKAKLGLVAHAWEEFATAADRMASKPLREMEAKEAVIAIFGDPALTPEAQPNLRAMGQVLDLYQGRARGANLPSARGTAWGLLHAATEYLDHHAPERKTGARLTSAWTGRGDLLKRRALEVCHRLAA